MPLRFILVDLVFEKLKISELYWLLKVIIYSKKLK